MTNGTDLQHSGNVTPFTPRSTPSTHVQMRPSAAQVDMGRKAAKKILTSYPDYGKAPPEYGVNLAEYLSYLSEDEIAIVMHPKHGITGRSAYLPTNADIQALLREYEEKRRQFEPRHTHYQRFASVCTEKDMPQDRTAFRSFPRLWAVFKDEPWLLKGHTFEVLADASRSLSMLGQDAARDVLARRVGA